MDVLASLSAEAEAGGRSHLCWCGPDLTSCYEIRKARGFADMFCVSGGRDHLLRVPVRKHDSRWRAATTR